MAEQLFDVGDVVRAMYQRDLQTFFARWHPFMEIARRFKAVHSPHARSGGLTVEAEIDPLRRKGHNIPFVPIAQILDNITVGSR